MDSENKLEPVMGVKLVFEDGEMGLRSEPPIDLTEEGSFFELVEDLLKDIINMSKLLPRVGACHSHSDYFVR